MVCVYNFIRIHTDQLHVQGYMKYNQIYQYRRMGNQEGIVVQGKQNQKKTTFIKPTTKINFKYIDPVVLDDDTQLIQGQNVTEKQIILTQISKKVNEEEYAIMEEEAEQPQTQNDHEDIRIKWNNFIKMKHRNYLDDYIIVKEIGRGGFGKVNKVRSKYTGLYRAAKKIKKSTLGKTGHQKLFMEMTIMRSLDHINVVRLFQVYDYKSYIVLILELCEGGQLFKKIVSCKEIPQDHIARTVKQILKVLLYLNHRGVVHRDLKPENMLFEKDSNMLKIIDFGISCFKNESQRLTQRIGTPYYVAPQVLLKNYDEKCDIWSIGVIMYIMMAKKPPFRGDDEYEIMQRILQSQPAYKEDIKINYSNGCMDLLKRMLCKNPQGRISATDAYNHPWIRNAKDDLPLPQNQKEVIQSIQSFKFKNKLQAVVYTFIVSQLLTTEEKFDFIEIFQDMDKNHDGVIGKVEFCECLRTKSKISQNKMAFLMKAIDTNSSSQIDLTEFIVACEKMKDVFTKSHFQQAFAYFDIDHSGAISFQEIAFFLEDSRNSQETIKKIFQQVDQNGDGTISKEEFVLLLAKGNKGKKTIQKC